MSGETPPDSGISYFLTTMNVGLVTCSVIPAAFATPWVKTVFPEPISPHKATMVALLCSDNLLKKSADARQVSSTLFVVHFIFSYFNIFKKRRATSGEV